MDESGEDESGELRAEDLREARPPVDRLDLEAARERSERVLFGSAPAATVGRYELLGDAAGGNMGIVRSAFDPRLRRRVALKVLHPQRLADARNRDRLSAEGQALAQLDHPNVVKVHDVFSQGEQVVIVMEWVEGRTLADWERELPRSWRDVVAVYAQAGHGLAAAHGVGVMHRDFKPSNVIVGADGRVRVLDFGLARSVQAERAIAAGSGILPAAVPMPDGGDATLTATGDMVGTLAYAAPEQIVGDATAASDQFSFAVSLHRALEGVAPFAGCGAEDLMASIRSGRIATAGDARVVPAWLRAAIARGLAADPAARFPSMATLLFELGRPRGWRRWRIPVLEGACIVLAVLAVILWKAASDPLGGCDSGRDQVAKVWSAAEHGRVEAALRAATAGRNAGEITRRVVGGLDDYRERWAVLHREACVAHRGGVESAALLDRRMLCLTRRLGDLRATVAVLGQLAAGSAGNSVDVVARMPRVADCADAERLQAETAPPDRDRRALVDVVRTLISRAMALDRAGQSRSALAEATAAVQLAELGGYRPIVADAALIQGRILLARQDTAPAIAALRRAREIALAEGQFAVAIEAGARALYLERIVDADFKAARLEADLLLPLGNRLGGDRFAGPLLLNNLGSVYVAARNRREGARYFQAAHDALIGVEAPDLELGNVDLNLAMLTPDAARREALARGVWQRFERELGESHLWTVRALEQYARFVPDPRRAFALLSGACRAYAESYPEMTDRRIYCQSYLALLSDELGDRSGAVGLYDQIAGLGADAIDEDPRDRAGLARGYARLLRGDAAGAVAELRRIADANGGDHWWSRARVAHAELGVGLAEHARGRDAAAACYLERAIADYQDPIAQVEEAEFRLRVALARRTLDGLSRAAVAQPAAAKNSRERGAAPCN